MIPRICFCSYLLREANPTLGIKSRVFPQFRSPQVENSCTRESPPVTMSRHSRRPRHRTNDHLTTGRTVLLLSESLVRKSDESFFKLMFAISFNVGIGRVRTQFVSPITYDWLVGITPRSKRSGLITFTDRYSKVISAAPTMQTPLVSTPLVCNFLFHFLCRHLEDHFY